MLSTRLPCYTFRADRLSDVLELLPLIRFSYLDMFAATDGSSNVRVTIETPLPISALGGAMQQVRVGSVMLETLGRAGDDTDEV